MVAGKFHCVTDQVFFSSGFFHAINTTFVSFLFSGAPSNEDTSPPAPTGEATVS